jgi:ferritin-like metal-binding protein YciE
LNRALSRHVQSRRPLAPSGSATEQQIERFEEVLATFGETQSSLKDIGLSISGNLAAIAHVFAPDNIPKNTFANFASENFEAASYKSLIMLADAASFGKVTPLLTTSLDEELSMANWLGEHNAELTLAYIQRRAAGDDASH